MNFRSNSRMLAAIGTLAWISFAAPAPVQAGDASSCAPRQAAAAASDSGDVLAMLRTECPLLAGIVEEFALQDLGEVLPRGGIRPIALHGVSVADVTVSDDVAALRRHAEDAISVGATRDELREMLYLTVVHAGAARALEVTRALSDLVAVPAQNCSVQAPARG
jgi:4-carboxymuconolactone decarboxylase